MAADSKSLCFALFLLPLMELLKKTKREIKIDPMKCHNNAIEYKTNSLYIFRRISMENNNFHITKGRLAWLSLIRTSEA